MTMTLLIPNQGKLAGIDYGTVRVGVAICDAYRTISSPFEIYQRRSPPRDTLYFQQLAREERLVGFIVGLPLHMSGEESQKSYEARQFAKWLGDVTQLPFTFQDERLSSTLAEDWLLEAGLTNKQRKAKLDKLAAQLILSCYLENQKQQTTLLPPDATS
jgi:putative holliday junction resolvase